MSVSAVDTFSIDMERQLGPSPPPGPRTVSPTSTTTSLLPTPTPVLPRTTSPTRRPRTTTPRPISGAELGDRRSRRMSRAAFDERPASRNFLRPSSRPSSVAVTEREWPRRRRSSDDLPLRRPFSSHDIDKIAEMTELPGNLPPFAPRPHDYVRLSTPPSVAPSSAGSPATITRIPRTRKPSAKSVDVMDAARQMAWNQKSEAVVTTYSVDSDWDEKTKAESSEFERRVLESGKPDLTYDLCEKQRFKDRVDGVLDLTTLQRMNQHVLQQRLVEQVKAIGDKGAWMDIGVKQTLHDYCEAVRDMQFMEQCALRGRANDPFLITTTKPLEAKLLEDAGFAFGHAKGTLSSIPSRLTYTKRQSDNEQVLRRLLVALLGGFALVLPFLIMILASGQAVRIVMTVLCTVGVAVAMTFGSELGTDRIALVTAAYAAALVVFVGANPPSYPHGA